jgi:probable HAF family extracellular repeat protein
MTAVTTPTGYSSSQPTAISDSGQIVGWFYKGPNMYYGFAHAFLYSGGTMTDLGTFPGSSWEATSYASAINASGQVVGSCGFGIQHAFLYSSGTMTDLGTLPGYSWSVANGINASGQVVGYVDTGSGDQHAFFYSGGTMSNLGVLPGGSYSLATGINSTGQIVGYGSASDGYEDAFLFDNGTMTDLNSLIDPSSGWRLERATAINDSGQVVGYGGDGGNIHAFLLTPSPTPEPSTFVLLAIGAISLLGYCRRKWTT